MSGRQYVGQAESSRPAVLKWHASPRSACPTFRTGARIPPALDSFSVKGLAPSLEYQRDGWGRQRSFGVRLDFRASISPSAGPQQTPITNQRRQQEHHRDHEPVVSPAAGTRPPSYLVLMGGGQPNTDLSVATRRLKYVRQVESSRPAFDPMGQGPAGSDSLRSVKSSA